MMKKIALFFTSIFSIFAFIWYVRYNVSSTGRMLGNFASFNFLIFVIILIVINLIVIFYIFRSGRIKNKEAEAAPSPKTEGAGTVPEVQEVKTSFSGSELSRSFSEAAQKLKQSVSESDYRYSIPWYLMLGETDSGKTAALNHCGLHLPAGNPFSGLTAGKSAVKQACSWWFFERGIVLDIAGDLFLKADRLSADRHGSDSSMWQKLIRLLQKHRPKRPVDGIVLTIPCTDLIPPEDSFSEKDPAYLHSLAAKADLIHKKVWNLQKELGIRFPVYILITKCNEIEGFNPFCKEIPSKLAGNMFGWSNPYPLDTLYSPGWVDEAFEQIGTDLFSSQFELFTEGVKPENRDGLFLLRGHFQAISRPLQTYLDRIFAPSAYHEMFMMRGIYFTGDEGFFLKDLFDGKIFPESGIARPLKRTLISRNRRVTAFQATAVLISVILFAGLWRDSSRLYHDSRELQAFVETINVNTQRVEKFIGSLQKRAARGKPLKELNGADLYNVLKDASGQKMFENAAEQLIKGLSEVTSMKYPFIPASMFSEIHAKNETAMVLAYNLFIINGMTLRLMQKTASTFDILKQEDSSYLTDSKNEAVSIEKEPEFEQLENFIKDFRKLEDIAYTYINLKNSKDIKELGDVIEYLYNINLPEAFFHSGDYYQKALGNAYWVDRITPILHMKHRTATLKKFRQLYERIFTFNPLLQRLQALSIQLNEFKEKSRNSVYDEQLIRDTLKNITHTQALLNRPELKWIFSEELNLGKDFNGLVVAYSELRSFDPNYLTSLEKEKDEAFKKLRGDLALQKSSLTGPLLRRKDDRIINELSPVTLAFASDLKRLLDQDFMIADKDRIFDIAVPAGMRIFWNIPVLNNAVQLFRPYEEFMKTGLKNFPKEMQHSIQNVALSNLEKSLIDKIGEAIRTEPAPLEIAGYFQTGEVNAEIRNFSEASKLLHALMLYSRRLKMADLHYMLSNILYAQPIRLLKIIDRYLEDEDLYHAKGRNFKWWDGAAPLSLTAFEAADDEELKFYLKLQRERIRHLAFEYAEPLIAFLSASNIVSSRKEEKLFIKWSRILAELDKYENKEPENSLTALEKFILFDMKGSGDSYCLEKISGKEIRMRSGDFFLRRRNELRRNMYRRCTQISSDYTIEQYDALKEMFDEKLAGRFPFSGIDADEDVSFEAVQDFYLVFDQEAPVILSTLAKDKRFGFSGQKTAQFMAQMKNVREFFGHFLADAASPLKEKEGAPMTADAASGDAAKKPDSPAFGFNIRFRADRADEIVGNRIIEWKFNSGGQTVRYRDEKTDGVWLLGDPIDFTLRWARNGMDYPVFAGKFGQVDSENRTVNYRFKDLWSLLRFIRAFNTAGHSSVQKSNLLGFRIDAEQLGEDMQIQDRYQTKVFLRIALNAPGKSAQTLLMPSFPAAAPDLDADAFGKNRHALKRRQQ